MLFPENGIRVYTQLPYFIEKHPSFNPKFNQWSNTDFYYVVCMMVSAQYSIELSGSSESIYNTLEGAIKRVNELAEGK